MTWASEFNKAFKKSYPRYKVTILSMMGAFITIVIIKTFWGINTEEPMKNLLFLVAGGFIWNAILNRPP